MELSQDEISRLAQDLVYQVAYAFYDSPYILLLKLLVQTEVAREIDLAATVGITANEIRKYLGTLHVHRLVRRHVNKERQPVPDWKRKENLATLGPGQKLDDRGRPELRVRDVIYWYIDYREVANVVKYRLAMMRKGIDERIKQEVGHRGYICPNCRKTYESLEMGHLFDPATNGFHCEVCQTELIEHDPSQLQAAGNENENENGTTTNQDKMQRFNVATAPIRDALKAVEGVMLPSLNIAVWIANNVKSDLGNLEDGQGGREESKRKIEVVVGGEGAERERLEKERLAEEQRTQNALPVWHTHSTVTGSATSLGLANARASGSGRSTAKEGKQEMDDAALAAHYAMLEGDGSDDEDGGFESVNTLPVAVVSTPSGKKEELMNGDDDEEMEDVGDGIQDVQADGTSGDVKMVMVGGVPKPLADVTEEDEEEMSPDEYTAYYEAANEV